MGDHTLGIPSQDDEQGGKRRQPTIPAQDKSSMAPKPISPIWERFPMMLASVETNNVPFTGAAMCSSRLVMAGME